MTAYRLGSLCTGSAALDLAVAQVLPVEHAWFAEIDPAASTVLATRFPDVPNHGDITAVNWAAVQPVDILTAGFPCQDVSVAGKRAGLAPGTRSGLWSWVAHVIATTQPKIVFLENVRGLLSARADSDMEPCPWCLGNDSDQPALRALGAVLGDLADLRYDATWYGLPASDLGAAHQRFRVFIVATPAADAQGDRHGHPWQESRGRIPAAAVGSAVRPDGLTLLPTPAARDAGRGAGWGDQPGRPLSETVMRLLPTPQSRDGDPQRGTPSTEVAAERVASGRRNLDDAVALLPTPTCSDSRGPGGHGEGGIDLRTAIALLPTPRATDGSKGGPNQRGSSGDLMLPSAVTQLLPTPTVADARGTRNATANRANPKPTTQTDGWTLGDVAHADRWGTYAPAIARWEQTLKRPAPDPTEPGTKGQPRLSARFAEWLMGWPDGWVTNLVGRNDALRIIGNGVVPQQAAHALQVLLDLHYAADPSDDGRPA